MTIFLGAINQIFTSPISEPAVYVPQAGAPVSVRILRKSPDIDAGFGDASVIRKTDLIELRVSDVAEARAGDRIELGAGGPSAPALLIQGKPRRDDPARLVWTLDVKAL